MMGNNITKTAKSAFTLAEMMVVLLIMSIILAAMAPVMTTRMSSEKSSENTSPWHWIEGRKNIDAYLRGNLDNQRAIIGDNTIATDGTENARLILKTSDSIKDHIIFKNADTKLGSLKFAGSGIGLGLEVLESVTSGTNLLAIGNGGLKNNTTGANNIAVGMNSLVNNTEGSYNSAFGVDTLNSNKLGNYNTAVGYQALMHNDFDPSCENSASRNVAVGYSALKKNTLGYSNVAIGAEALSGNATGQSNIAIGDLALSSSNGNNNIAIGRKALSKNSSGQHNVAIGREALNSSETASYNTAIGYQALASNKTGNQNTAIGTYALKSNTEGNSNISIGNYALNDNLSGSKNIAIGSSAMRVITAGGQNIAIGDEALFSGNKDNMITGGNNNIAIGTNALRHNEGNRNIGIGLEACSNVANYDNNICIGPNAGPYNGVYSPGGGLYIRANGYLFTMDQGRVNFSGVSAVQLNGSSLSNVSSDRRLKNIGNEYTSSLDKIRRIKPLNFTFKKDKNKTPHVGVIAQDLQKIFPDAVQKDDNGYLTIRQEDMFYAVINAIKELDAKIMQLIETLKQVQKDIYVLRQENSEIKKRLDALEKK